MPGCVGPWRRRAAAVLTVVPAVCFALLFSPPLSAPNDEDVAGLCRQIRDEILGLDKYPGEDFNRGEFHLGPGDDDTNKTHAVGILVKSEAEGFRMTIMVSRLEPSRDNPRIMYAQEPLTIVCRFPEGKFELLRSDYPAGELEELLPAVLRAVVDKKNLLKLKWTAGRRVWQDLQIPPDVFLVPFPDPARHRVP
jgi:hypothetical protein